MFHERQINDKINKLHERVLRIVYNDTVTSFKNLLIKDKSFTIHHQSMVIIIIIIFNIIYRRKKFYLLHQKN